MKSLHIILFLQLALFSCSHDKKANIELEHPLYSLDDVVSLEGVDDRSETLPKSVVSIIDSCIRNECHWRFNRESGKEVFIRYSKTYFSPDSTKLLTIVTHQINDVENRAFPQANLEIRGDAFIGYTLNEDWIVYHFGMEMPAGFFSYKKVENGMINFFEGENFREKSPLYRYENGRKWTDHVYASPNESKFWSSNLWVQNLEIEGVYPFEIKRSNVNTVRVKSINQLVSECQ